MEDKHFYQHIKIQKEQNLTDGLNRLNNSFSPNLVKTVFSSWDHAPLLLTSSGNEPVKGGEKVNKPVLKFLKL